MVAVVIEEFAKVSFEQGPIEEIMMDNSMAFC